MTFYKLISTALLMLASTKAMQVNDIMIRQRV